MMLLKKSVHDKLVAKANNIDTSRFVLKTKYETDKSELGNKYPDTSVLVKKLDYKTKVTEIENEIPSVRGLAANATSTALKSDLKNKIPNINSEVKKTDYNTKIIVIEKKKLLIMVMANILLLQNLISLQQKFLLQG